MIFPTFPFLSAFYNSLIPPFVFFCLVFMLSSVLRAQHQFGTSDFMFVMDLIRSRDPSVIGRCFRGVPASFIQVQGAMLQLGDRDEQQRDDSSSKSIPKEEQEGEGKAEEGQQKGTHHKHHHHHHHHKKPRSPPPKGTIHPFMMQSASHYAKIDERLASNSKMHQHLCHSYSLFPSLSTLACVCSYLFLLSLFFASFQFVPFLPCTRSVVVFYRSLFVSLVLLLAVTFLSRSSLMCLFLLSLPGFLSLHLLPLCFQFDGSCDLMAERVERAVPP